MRWGACSALLLSAALDLSGGEFDDEHEEKSREGQNDRREQSAVAGGHDVGVVQHVVRFPGPDFAQGAQHEADEDRHGEVMVFSEEPRKETDETRDARDDAAAEEGQRQEIFRQVLQGFEFVDGVEHVVVPPHEEQDETARDPRQDHGADGHGSAEDQIPLARGRVRQRGKPHDEEARRRSEDEGGDPVGAPLFHLPEHRRRGAQNQPEEEGEDQRKAVVQHPLDARGKEGDGAQNPQRQHKEKGPGQSPVHFPEAESYRHFRRFGRKELLDGVQQFVVDAEDEGHGPPGNPGDDIRRAHDGAAEENFYVFAQGPPARL